MSGIKAMLKPPSKERSGNTVTPTLELATMAKSFDMMAEPHKYFETK